MRNEELRGQVPIIIRNAECVIIGETLFPIID